MPFCSAGVNARSACCTLLPSWESTLPGMSLGFCVQKYIDAWNESHGAAEEGQK